jgi:galactonate dehydratase
VGGYVPPPVQPGPGIELDDEAVAAQVFPGDSETPALRHPDGSVSDW